MNENLQLIEDYYTTTTNTTLALRDSTARLTMFGLSVFCVCTLGAIMLLDRSIGKSNRGDR